MNPPPRIVVVGSINMDFVLRAPRIPRIGETIRSSADLETFAGGKGANQAHAAVKLGASVAMIGCVGDDSFGSRLRDGLALAGVDTAHVQTIGDAATGVALIVVDDEGHNTIVVSSGANRRLRPEDVIGAADLIAAADIVLLQLEVPLAVVEAATKLAGEHGVTTVLDPAPYRPLPPGLLAQISIIVPNETEAASLAGKEISGPDGFERVGAALRRDGVGAVIVTRGKDGATLVAADGTRHFAAHRVEAVDSTAAGDAFVGALAVALGEGKTLDDAIGWGNAAGAIAATRHGAQPSLPSRAEVEALLHSGGAR